ncbi:MAG: 3-hydroxyacyl-CoA dehydrogenase NAD-binding domain-containing protein, partial [Desulfuromonadales bacterium]|nr:3-hydroxyacyl-CoA dehydrogenase NAD-binding domain-containing protein [Desulfuromonadales bacterium]
MIKHIGVLGAGQMGNGIAHTFAQYGYEVLLYDIGQPQLDKALATIRQNLERQAKKGTIPEEVVSATLGRIRTTLTLADFHSVDFAVEAATENEALKLEIFRQLDAIARPGAILASNTSSIPITKIASVTKRPEQVIGMHFMNPVPLMKLVE